MTKCLVVQSTYLCLATAWGGVGANPVSGQSHEMSGLALAVQSVLVN
jgi:hypothetical protein